MVDDGLRLTPASALPHYVAVQVEDRKYLVPQRDLRTLEPLADVDTADPPAGAVGSISLPDETLPVYCLSGALDQLRRQPGGQSICAVLGGGAGSYGLLCAEATLISAADVEVHAVPTAMCRADSVMESLALHDGGVVCVSSAAALLRVIHNLRPPQ